MLLQSIIEVALAGSSSHTPCTAFPCRERGCGREKGPFLQAEGLQCWLRVLKGKVCLKNIFITTPELPGRGGEFYINTLKNNPIFFFSYTTQISAVRFTLTLLLLNSLRKWSPVPLDHNFFFLFRSWIHKIHFFRTAPSSLNPLQMLGARIDLEKAPVSQWRWL